MKMLKEMDKTKDLAKIFRKWFGDLPLTLYHNGKTSGYKPDKCPIIAEMKRKKISLCKTYGRSCPYD